MILTIHKFPLQPHILNHDLNGYMKLLIMHCNLIYSIMTSTETKLTQTEIDLTQNQLSDAHPQYLYRDKVLVHKKKLTYIHTQTQVRRSMDRCFPPPLDLLQVQYITALPQPHMLY